VEIGEFGRDRLAIRCVYGSSSSCECDRDIECPYAYADSDGKRPLLLW
jgi:hypothetical protein